MRFELIGFLFCAFFLENVSATNLTCYEDEWQQEEGWILKIVTCNHGSCVTKTTTDFLVIPLRTRRTCNVRKA